MTNKLTIGLVLDDTLDRSDGVQQSVVSIGHELSKRGHSVHYIVPETTRSDIQNIHSIGKLLNVRFNANSVRTPLPASRKKIKKIFTEISFDVLHVQMPYSPFFAAKVLDESPDSVVRVGTFHILPFGLLSTYGTKLLGIVLRRSIKKMQAVFAVSQPAKIFMDKSFNVNGIIVPNPVDYKFFNSFKKTKSNKKQIVYVGRFEQRKGIIELNLTRRK